ncbi:(deoxy)nucleoside triphosphate pyrophosphohydrolase [Erythrobacter sp. MTPC3]|uniref:(deoxy)nucleoside triphosphate pyrophosphohydrolase n=1 Tax=Erythrobacter sp. MTPC3 TaxID=3056564 RepID=UPI0036F2CE29
MVEKLSAAGKNSDISPLWLAVVAGALCRSDGRWLMHRRPLTKQHGGLWEFPGGKVEASEKPVESLARELQEELGITVHAEQCAPVAFAEERGQADKKPIVILLYKVSIWDGDPISLEGGGTGWFTPDEIRALDKPPLDCELTRSLFGKE